MWWRAINFVDWQATTTQEVRIGKEILLFGSTGISSFYIFHLPAKVQL